MGIMCSSVINAHVIGTCAGVTPFYLFRHGLDFVEGLKVILLGESDEMRTKFLRNVINRSKVAEQNSPAQGRVALS